MNFFYFCGFPFDIFGTLLSTGSWIRRKKDHGERVITRIGLVTPSSLFLSGFLHSLTHTGIHEKIARSLVCVHVFYQKEIRAAGGGPTINRLGWASQQEEGGEKEGSPRLCDAPSTEVVCGGHDPERVLLRICNSRRAKMDRTGSLLEGWAST